MPDLPKEKNDLPVLDGPAQNQVRDTGCCGSGIPEQVVVVNGHNYTLIALPLIFQQFLEDGKPVSRAVARELLDIVKVYNPVSNDQDDAFIEALAEAYAIFRKEAGVP